MIKLTTDTLKRESQVFEYNGKTYEATFGYGYGNNVYFYLWNKTNAYKRGKICYRMSFEAKEENVGFQEFTNEITYFCDLMTEYENSEVTKEVTLNGEKYTLYFSTEKAMSVPPVSYEHIKPLKEAPSNWTKTHVIKLLANNQFKNFKKKSRYTDDYAYDAATNYGEGLEMSAKEMIKELIRFPSGWWFRQQGNTLSINCHSFDYNELEIAI